MKKLASILLAVICLFAIPMQALAYDLSALGDLFGALEDMGDTQEPAEDSEEVPEFSGPLVEVDIGGETVEVHEDFKEYMDEYESYFDSYIEIMTDDDANELEILGLMTDYLEMLESFEALDNAELSEGDTAYYLAVSARIYAKLATIE